MMRDRALLWFTEGKRIAVHQYIVLLVTTRFLTVLPLPWARRLAGEEQDTVDFVAGYEYFPIVGAVLALLLWIIVLLLSPFLPQLVLAALLALALILLTGGLHLDGLMDSCDGLFGGTTDARRLEIMHDSHVGSFGVLGGVGAVLLKFTLLASIHVSSLPFVLLVALPAARWAVVLATLVFPAARAVGLGADFHQLITTQRVIITTVITALIALVFGHILGLIALCVIALLTMATGYGITRSIGGLTGDSYGAIIEVMEIAALLVAVVLRT